MTVADSSVGEVILQFGVDSKSRRRIRLDLELAPSYMIERTM